MSEGNPRNNVTTASHGFFTRDGAHPSELAAVGLSQLKKYPTVRAVTSVATAVQSADGLFLVGDNGKQGWRGRRVIIATGYRDVLSSLAIHGIEDVYGKTVYPCPFCDGFEHADERLAVFMAEGVEHFVPVVRMWSKDVVVFTNGRALSTSQHAELDARGVRVENEPIARLISESGILRKVELKSGKEIGRDAGFIGDDFSVESTTFANELGVHRRKNSWGMEVLEADEAGRTNVEGVFVIGDAKAGFSGVMAAANQGASCVESIVHEIAAHRWHMGERGGANT